MIKKHIYLLLVISLIGISFMANAEEKITVFAAASLTNALSDISTQYEKEKSVKIQNSFAASSTLAKQIENGAPVDIFISADSKWMNYLQDKKLINSSSRKDFLGNKLVLIAPKDRSFSVKFEPKFNIAKAFDGRLCTGDIESVPAGMYAKEALTNLKWWDAIKTRIVGTQDVRGALAFVERGECAAGIVYETDAKISNKVEIVGTFPEQSHTPIVYPMAMTANMKNPQLGSDFSNYLLSKNATAIFKKYGFNVINP
ncbi:MAG TPA: molybdate ABC transporter substrate-binding protein [Methylotenera sp.]|nr:molybdate ABC transporter substrate-binding protein [Methylotenera sp.]